MMYERIGYHWTQIDLRTLHTLPKSRLAAILASGIVGKDNHYRRSLTKLNQLCKWSKDELVTAIRDMVQ